MLTHDQIVGAISQLYPGSEWSYDGDGSTLEPMYDADAVLVSRGLEWHDATKTAPTLDQLETYVASNPVTTYAAATDHTAASNEIITAQLAAARIPRDEIAPILQSLLGQAASAIPFFEQYALAPAMNAQQWTDFQALDQTKKDRLQYDTIRTLAAVLRYLTGDLPSS